MANGVSRDVTQARARNFNTHAWLPGGKALLLEGDDGTGSALWQQPLQGAAKKLELGDVQASPDLSVSRPVRWHSWAAPRCIRVSST